MIKKQLQAGGVLPPDKPRLNRRKFIQEAREEYNAFAKECMVSDLYLHRAVSVLLGMVKRNSPTPEAVGGAKALKLAVRLREFDQMVKAGGIQNTGFQSSMTISRTYWRRKCEEKKPDT